MEFLKDINWKSDDGVFLPMLNDVARNTFYEQIIKPNVYKKHCVDIGFGTGLLSMIALKHGATHVTAYEVNETRYQLGQLIIKELGLQDCIDLIHDQYSWQMPISKDSVIFSETAGPGIWGEGMWSTIPRTSGYTFLPGQWLLNIEVVPASQNILDLIETRIPNMHAYFAPGVDMDTRFVELINQLMSAPSNTETSTKQGIIHFDYLAQPVWGGGLHHRLTRALGQKVASYNVNILYQTLITIDANGTKIQPIDFGQPKHTLSVDLSLYSQPVILVPRVGMKHNELTLMLDDAESWHWMSHPVLVTPELDRVNISHDFITGEIDFQVG